MVLVTLILLSIQPFNAGFSYPEDQAGKGAGFTDFGCITAGNTSLDPSGNMQIIYAVYDQTGNFLWTDSFHFEQSSEILAIRGWNGGLLFTGSSGNQSTSEDAMAYAVSSGLQELWSYTLDLPLQDRFSSAAQGTDGTLVCAGSTNSIGAGGNDVLIVALDQNGEQLWQKTYGTAGEEAVYHISSCSDGGYILACQAMNWGAGNGDYWIIKTDFKGDTLWTGTYGGPEFDYPWRVIQSGDFFYVAGNTLSYGEGSYDWWILKLDGSGNVVWSKTWGYGNTDTCMALEERNSGVIVAGSSEAVLNQFPATAVSFDQNGNVIDEWFYQPGMIRSIEAADNGCFLMGGTTFSSDEDLWVAFVDSTGYAPELGISPDENPGRVIFSGNPACESVRVILPAGTTRVTVRDIYGRMVCSQRVAGSETILDVSGLPSGVYTVSTDGLLCEKFTVLR